MAVSRKTKLSIYGTVIRSVVICGSEVQTLSNSNMGKENTEKNICRSKKKHGILMNRTNQELMDLYREPDIISEIIKTIKGRLRMP